MTKSVDIIDTEFAGAMKVRIADVDITNYDDGATGNGESFVPGDTGMHRFQSVSADVKYGEGNASTVVNCSAEYDWDNESLRLLYGGTDGGELSEVAQNSDEGAMVRVTCFGR